MGFLKKILDELWQKLFQPLQQRFWSQDRGWTGPGGDLRNRLSEPLSPPILPRWRTGQPRSALVSQGQGPSPRSVLSSCTPLPHSPNNLHVSEWPQAPQGPRSLLITSRGEILNLPFQTPRTNIYKLLSKHQHRQRRLSVLNPHTDSPTLCKGSMDSEVPFLTTNAVHKV